MYLKIPVSLKTRDLLIEKYLNNPDETESIDKIKSLLDNYTIENKLDLRRLRRYNHKKKSIGYLLSHHSPNR
jgi:hypothetical protein